MSKFDAARCQTLRRKCTEFDFRWGSVPDPTGGAYSIPPDLLAVFKWAYFKGEGGKEGGEGRKGRRKGEERQKVIAGEGERGGASPQYFGQNRPWINAGRRIDDSCQCEAAQLLKLTKPASPTSHHTHTHTHTI